MKPILYFDLDNTLVDFQTGIDRILEDEARKHLYEKDEVAWDEVEGIFGLMKPMPGAIEAVLELKEDFELFILSTAPWKNPSAWSDKLEWVNRHFSEITRVNEKAEAVGIFHKRLILTHRKDLLFRGNEYLIDDRPNNGAEAFGDHWIKFGPEGENVINHLSEEQKRQCWKDAVAELRKRCGKQ